MNKIRTLLNETVTINQRNICRWYRILQRWSLIPHNDTFSSTQSTSSMCFWYFLSTKRADGDVLSLDPALDNLDTINDVDGVEKLDKLIESPYRCLNPPSIVHLRICDVVPTAYEVLSVTSFKRLVRTTVAISTLVRLRRVHQPDGIDPSCAKGAEQLNRSERCIKYHKKECIRSCQIEELSRCCTAVCIDKFGHRFFVTQWVTSSPEHMSVKREPNRQN